jgi:hypothetical protein
MCSSTVKHYSQNKKAVAFLICVYKNDNFEWFKEMLSSINELEAPKGFEIRVYLHIDGVLPAVFNPVIDDFHPYKVLQSEESVGLANGLNKLIDTLADELYYFRMDSDDICHPQRIVKQINFMNDNPNIDFCGSSISEFIGSKENQVNVRTYPNNMDSIHDKIVRGSPFAHVTVCFKAGFFKKFGVYPIMYPLNEDIALWFLSLRSGAVASNLADVLVHVRMDSAYSRRTFQKATTELQVYKKIAHWQGRSFFYPYLRFFFRLFPVVIVKKIYNSKIRDILLK